MKLKVTYLIKEKERKEFENSLEVGRVVGEKCRITCLFKMGVESLQLMGQGLKN